METTTFFQGLILGFSIAAPVGPIGVLCIRRTLAEGQLSGFLSGMGAATADAFYGAVAAFGLTLISDRLVAQQFWLRLIGALFLAYLGVKTLLSRPAENAATAEKGRSYLSAYASTLLLTITNPMTILAFTGMFLGITAPGSDYRRAALLVLGVFLGSALWWLSLSGVVNWLRTRVTGQAMLWVNRASGLIILGFALILLRSLV